MADAKLADKIHIVAPELLEIKVEDLDLSVRTHNCLVNDNLQTVGDVIQKSETELLRIPNFGRKSFKEISDKLNDLGLGFIDRSLPTEVSDHLIIKQTITKDFWVCPDDHAHTLEEAARKCAARWTERRRYKAQHDAERQAAEEAQRLAVEKRQREREEFKRRFAASDISKSGLDIRVAEALCDVGVIDRASFCEKFVKDNVFDLNALAYVPTLFVQDYPDILRWLNGRDAAVGESAGDPLQDFAAR